MNNKNKSIKILKNWIKNSKNFPTHKKHAWRILDYFEGMDIKVGCSIIWLINNAKESDDKKIIIEYFNFMQMEIF